MMHKGKNGQYVTAGLQAAPDVRLNVRSNVRLPDSEAGSSWYEEGPKPFYAAQVAARRRGPATVPLNSALLALCALFVVFGILALSRTVHKAAITKNISAMNQSIQETERMNSDLALQVAQARDLARIGYDAVNRLQMIDAVKADRVAVHAPNTRPYGETADGQADETAVPGGLLTGSR